MRTIVIGDTHGDHAGLWAILRATGAIDSEDRRPPDTRVIHLGDLIHGGTPRGAMRPGVDDEECAIVGLRFCDTVLIGNHELPHVWPAAGFPTFGGQQPLSPSLRVRLHESYLGGQLIAATSVGEWLLTHAGLHPDLKCGYAEIADDDVTAERVARNINAYHDIRIRSRLPIALLDGISHYRGGRHPEGGVFWCDWRELTAVGVTSPTPQIVGHTPQGDAPRRYGNLWCVDVGAALSGRVAALVSDDDGATWEPVVVESAAGKRLA